MKKWRFPVRYVRVYQGVNHVRSTLNIHKPSVNPSNSAKFHCFPRQNPLSYPLNYIKPDETTFSIAILTQPEGISFHCFPWLSRSSSLGPRWLPWPGRSDGCAPGDDPWAWCGAGHYGLRLPPVLESRGRWIEGSKTWWIDLYLGLSGGFLK